MSGDEDLRSVVESSRWDAALYLTGVVAVSLHGVLIAPVMQYCPSWVPLAVGSAELALYVIYVLWWIVLPRRARRRAKFSIYPLAGGLELQTALRTLGMGGWVWRVRDVVWAVTVLTWVMWLGARAVLR